MENRLLILFLFLGQYLFSQNISRSEYIDRYKGEAVIQMKKYNIPASITLAQAILESADGNSELAKKSNNHFGIKCHSNWDGEKVFHDDDKSDECFRAYNNVEESFEDHSKFLLKDRYSDLFKLDIDDYKSWAKGLKKAGYATNPDYAKHLIRIIEDNNLSRFDKESDVEKSLYSGFSIGWEDVVTQSYVLVKEEKKFYLSSRLSASFEDLSLMLGGGYLLNSRVGVGVESGVLSPLGNVDNVEFKTNYGLSTHFLLPIKRKKLNVRLSITTVDGKNYKPTIAIGLLR
ncbi:MAG: glucosaminidase domain-containing protein [Flavobacteriales bacterium]|nr:glucosaminidase domain-containing protein [Flavobacteriales bacterium]MBL6873170.1 glucosaminidase domain-containing protein [Flavobacteriales bacterium]